MWVTPGSLFRLSLCELRRTNRSGGHDRFDLQDGLNEVKPIALSEAGDGFHFVQAHPTMLLGFKHRPHERPLVFHKTFGLEVIRHRFLTFRVLGRVRAILLVGGK